MSIQPRYDASFLAVNDELTITIMQKKPKKNYMNFWNEASRPDGTRPRP